MVNAVEQTPTGYDIIGDVHGCYDALTALLDKLGYQYRSGRYRHTERKAVFLGDLLDRGPKIRETLHLVYNMVSSGDAYMVLGNHELNVIKFHTRSRDSTRGYLRERNDRHTDQIKETLDQFSGFEDELDSFINWFATLPLFLNFDNFRVAHACWDQQLIDQYYKQYRSATINEDVLHRSMDTKSTEFRLINRLTRGTNMLLPDNEVIQGSDGLKRRSFRTKFWLKNPQTYGEVIFQPDPLPRKLIEKNLTQEDRQKLVYYSASEKPLFVGHYWRRGAPELIRSNIACLDYSAVYGGKLVAYQRHEAGALDPGNFVCVDVEHDKPK